MAYFGPYNVQTSLEKGHHSSKGRLNPLHTKGVVFISYKNENANKDACHAHYLQQNPTDTYIFRKYIKYTFISNREIIGYIKIMTSRAA